MIHIRDIRRGDVVRIALRAGHQLVPDPHGGMAPPARPRRARGYEVAVLYGFVMQNDTQAGQLTVDLRRGPDQHYATATIPYGGIRFMQYVDPVGRQIVETAPAIHPGAKALGTRMSQLFPQPKLVRVRF